MMHILKRRSKCVCCLQREVTETVEEHLLDADCVPDQGNCDFSDYANYTIEGGVVLFPKPLISSTTLTPMKVICNDCLEDTRIKRFYKQMQSAGIL